MFKWIYNQILNLVTNKNKDLDIREIKHDENIFNKEILSQKVESKILKLENDINVKNLLCEEKKTYIEFINSNIENNLTPLKKYSPKILKETTLDNLNTILEEGPEENNETADNSLSFNRIKRNLYKELDIMTILKLRSSHYEEEYLIEKNKSIKELNFLKMEVEQLSDHKIQWLKLKFLLKLNKENSYNNYNYKYYLNDSRIHNFLRDLYPNVDTPHKLYNDRDIKMDNLLDSKDLLLDLRYSNTRVISSSLVIILFLGLLESEYGIDPRELILLNNDTKYNDINIDNIKYNSMEKINEELFTKKKVFKFSNMDYNHMEF